MCVGSAMPVATLPVTAHRDRLSALSIQFRVIVK